MKAYLLAPIWFITSFLFCLFFLTIGDFLLSAGFFPVPISIASFFSLPVLLGYIHSHAILSLIFAFFVLQYYLFTSHLRLGPAILVNVLSSFFVFLLLIPCFFFTGFATPEKVDLLTAQQEVETGMIYRTDAFQYTYLDTVLISTQTKKDPVLTAQSVFEPSLIPGTVPLIGQEETIEEVSLLNSLRLFEQHICQYLFAKLQTGYISYLIQCIGIALVIASLWPSLKLSSWNALNSFAFSATVVASYFVFKWINYGSIYAKITNPPRFLSEQLFTLIEYVLIALICNAGGIVGHILHKTSRKESN